jgi:hypothetical protein
VDAERLPDARAFEELGSDYPRCPRVSLSIRIVAGFPVVVTPQPPHGVGEVDRDDKPIVGSVRLLLPPRKGARDIGRQCPCARVGSLVLVEPDAAVFKVEVIPMELGEFREAHALAHEDAVGEATLERNRSAAKELPRALREVRGQLRHDSLDVHERDRTDRLLPYASHSLSLRDDSRSPIDVGPPAQG